METNQYNFFARIALMLTIAWISWSIYDSALRDKTADDNDYFAANKYFEDGFYEDALRSYRNSVVGNIYQLDTKRGIARSLMQLGREDEALDMFNEVIELEPDFAASYANRGILHDRIGNYQAAIADYQKALQLNPKLADGPKWLTRFFRNQVEKPPTILARMQYLQAEMAKPKDQRVLKLPKEDEKQQPYKL